MPIINRGKHGVTERTFKEIAGIGAWAGFCLDAGEVSFVATLESFDDATEALALNFADFSS